MTEVVVTGLRRFEQSDKLKFEILGGGWYKTDFAWFLNSQKNYRFRY
jgi:hypothetical protein